ncbi:carbohydrate ABC transporter permease [Paenibacillus sp. IITD108]|uniref:carbohydrate ABC transporter permease n=1 Tax=Paenibacillus sp. IITD108 TaxID=3116649 RepID=UPI002F422575
MGKSRRMNAKSKRKLEGLLFMSPWLLGFAVFMVFPLGFSLYMSFHNMKVLPNRMVYEFVGLKHYKEILFGSSALYDQMLPFFREEFIMIPIIIVFSLMIAILLNQNLRGRFLFRAIFFLPVIFSSGYVLTELVNQGEGSLGFLERFELGSYLDMMLGNNPWGDSVKAVLNRFVLVLWYSGVQILIFLAGRQTISNSAYEAARIDGASPWEMFWKITLPALSPFVLLNLIYTVVDLFTYPFNPIMNLIGLNQGEYGFNSALAWIYFLIIIVFLSVIVLIYSRFNKNSVLKRK